MTNDEKLKRALAEPWEFVGEPHVLLQIVRAECLRVTKENELLRIEQQQLLDEISYLKTAINQEA